MEMNKMNIMCFLLVGMFVVGFSCSQQVFAEDEESGNNLSLPVIWADGVEKVLRGTPGTMEEGVWVPGATTAEGNYWLAWTDSEGIDQTCDTSVSGECDEAPVDAIVVYPQRDLGNTWQAQSLLLDPISGDPPVGDPPVDVTFVDWGDNLEAKNWYYKAIIRTETVLYQDISAAPMTGYEMKWLDGLGVDEVWGSTLNTYDSIDATVYTGCGRLTIQGLSVDPYETVTVPVLDPNGDPVPVLGSNGEPKVDENGDIIYEEYEARVPKTNEDLGLTWNPLTSVWEGAVMDATHFNSVVWEATGSQDYEVYSAEINVKGKVIYGYNWNTRTFSDGPGYYRITFS
ncbi:MAG: hypothetical protein MUO22_06205, partial [Sedimentisphaerales bacterium]|nr:hypothetical protein [Sedimentisphaerales bacterium]